MVIVITHKLFMCYNFLGCFPARENRFGENSGKIRKTFELAV